jgi:hypothetical protein
VKITVLDVRKVDALDPSRRGKFDQLVIYSIDDGPGRLIRVPDEGFTRDRLEAAIKDDLRRADGMRGHSFTL